METTWNGSEAIHASHIYFHIPFCVSLCQYCDFISFTGKANLIDFYVDKLIEEMDFFPISRSLKTIYFGGGTPSLLEPHHLEKILHAVQNKYHLEGHAEISMESNPETVDFEKLKAYRRCGVTRLSLGAQAFQTNVLQQLGRQHDWHRIQCAFEDARKSGFENINLDIMMGLPFQTSDQFKKTIQEALKLNPDHLSIYALQVEAGTPLSTRIKNGLTLPDDDQVADEYMWVQDILQSNGFDQYEVSNFSKIGKHCRHNWAIWRGDNYIGLGVGAVGTVGTIRYSHRDSLKEFLQIRNGHFSTFLDQEFLPLQTRQVERVMLELRTSQGVLKSNLDFVFQDRQKKTFFEHLISQKYIVQRGDYYVVQPEKFFVLSGILDKII